MSKRRGIPGNTVGEAVEYQKTMIAYGEVLMGAERVFDRYFESEEPILYVKVRLPLTEGDEYLVVVGGYDSSGKVVAFHSAATFAEAIRGVVARLDNHSLKFKGDRYAD